MIQDESPETESKKIILVGDGCTGKTALLMVHSGLPFPEIYTPTIFENYVSSVLVKGKHVELSLWDTAGQEDYDRLRPLSYPDSDVVIIVYAVCNPESFQNVLAKWDPETKHFLPGIPRIIVGAKTDLRTNVDVVRILENSGLDLISKEQGAEVAKSLGALFFECSARNNEGIEEIFQAAARLATLAPSRRFRTGNQCLIL